jgi:WD40 repeat protein
MIATAERNGLVRIFEAESGNELFEFTAHHSDVGSVMFNPDDTRLLTAANDKTGKIWVFPTEDFSDETWSITEPVVKLTQPNGGEVLISDAQAYLRWEGTDPTRTVRLEYSTDLGQTWSEIASDISGYQYLWSVPKTDSRNCLARVTVGGNNGSVGRPLELKGHTSWINSASYSADGSLVATSSDDHSAKIWNAKTGQYLLSLNGSGTDVQWTAFSPTANIAATASLDGFARIWNLRDSSVIQLLRGHSAGVNSIVFSPDGARVATASEDGTAKIWDVATGKWLITLYGHSSGLYGVSYSPDGKRIATH